MDAAVTRASKTLLPQAFHLSEEDSQGNRGQRYSLVNAVVRRKLWNREGGGEVDLEEVYSRLRIKGWNGVL